jgi:hypothetical protein
MDVLQLLKAKHKQVLDMLAADNADGLAQLEHLKALIQALVVVKREYLYPELAASGAVNQRKLQRFEEALQSLMSLVGKTDVAGWDELRACVVAQFNDEEDILFPSIRQGMSTADREELAHVFEDAMDALPQSSTSANRAV